MGSKIFQYWAVLCIPIPIKGARPDKALAINPSSKGTINSSAGNVDLLDTLYDSHRMAPSTPEEHSNTHQSNRLGPAPIIVDGL